MITYTSKVALFVALARGERCGVVEDLFDEIMDLPPAYMMRRVELCDGTRVNSQFGYAEGGEVIVAFWREGGKCLAQHTKEVRRG